MDSPAAMLEFETIVHDYRPRVFRFALASLRDRDAAETVTQDCFLRTYHSLSSFRGESSLATWIMQIAVNLIRDHTRNRRLQFWRHLRTRCTPVDMGSEMFAGGGHTPEAQAVLRQEVKAVWAAAGRLPERQRIVFLLRFVEDMDILDIAAATGLSEGTVKTHLFRALDAVRKRLGQA